MAVSKSGVKFNGAGTRREAKSMADAFAMAGDDITTAVARGILECALLVEMRAKRNVHVDTGLLKGSISHYVEDEGTKIVGVVGTNVEYAPDEEFRAGGEHMFLTPALDRSRPDIIRILKKATKEGVDG